MASSKFPVAIIVFFILILTILTSANITIGATQISQTISSSGVVQYTSTGSYSYIISVSGLNVRMTDGTTGQIDYQSTNATQVANDAICNLTQGGNTLFKAGTYNLNGSITGRGINNIGLYFEKGATLFVSKGMNAPAISLYNCNNWLIQNSTINGNMANQANAAGAGGLGMSEYGIWIYGGSNNHVDDANITECGIYGFASGGDTSNIADENGITNSLITFCGWNGIIFYGQQYNLAGYAINNEVAYCGDVGIDTYALSTQIESNYVHDINGTSGYSNSEWGIAVEGGGNATITGNTITNCAEGMSIHNNALPQYGTCDSNTVTLNNIQHCIIGIHLLSSYNLVEQNQITQYNYLGGSGNAIGLSSANNNLIEGNIINSTYSVSNAIYMSASNNNQISGNSVSNPSTSASWSISFTDCNNTLITGNSVSGSKGILIYDAASTNNTIISNDLSKCATGYWNRIINTVATNAKIINNAGYNPFGHIASPIYATSYIADYSGTSATWVSGTTYINTESPKILYLSGGAVTGVAVDGTTLYTTAGSYTIYLAYGDTFSITFSVAPTITVIGE